MQRFTLLHDGNEQGWQATYLAFHFAAQLGAPLLVLLVDPTTDPKILARRAAQVEVGGRAAGVVIESRFVTDFSETIVAANVSDTDGLFLPRRLIPDGKTALRYLEALSCPIWVVSHEAKTYRMAVLVSDLTADEKLISFTAALSQRLQHPLIGLISDEDSASTSQMDLISTWITLPNFSHNDLAVALDQQGIDLLVIPVSRSALIDTLAFNFVVYPDTKGV